MSKHPERRKRLRRERDVATSGGGDLSDATKVNEMDSLASDRKAERIMGIPVRKRQMTLEDFLAGPLDKRKSIDGGKSRVLGTESRQEPILDQRSTSLMDIDGLGDTKVDLKSSSSLDARSDDFVQRRAIVDSEEAEVDVADSQSPEEEPDEVERKARKKATKKAKKSDVPLYGFVEETGSYELDLSSFAWNRGEPVPYAELAAVFEKCEAIRGRILMTNYICAFLRGVICLTPEDLLPCVYLCSNTLAPPYEGCELGLGESTITAAMSRATSMSVKQITQKKEALGDLGRVAKEFRATQKTFVKPKTLLVRDVFKKLKQIARLTGKESVQEKKNYIFHLLSNAKKVEALFIVRHLQGKMRMNVSRATVLMALAYACALSPPELIEKAHVHSKSLRVDRIPDILGEAGEVVRTAYCECPSFDKIIAALLETGLSGLQGSCHLQEGIPVHPMLAKPTKGVSVVLDRLSSSDFTCEFKYDGERAQIHRTSDGTIRVYSRNLEDNTGKYPDIVAFMRKSVKKDVSSFILDCEAVAFDEAARKILPFQVLSTRSRKDVTLDGIKVHVMLFAFDLLSFDGKSLLKEPFLHRRNILRESFIEKQGSFQFASSSDLSAELKIEDKEKIIMDFFKVAIENACEGLMCKSLIEEATYEPEKRSNNWLKLKKDYLSGMSDSLDLVPMGAFYGAGKRTGWFGAYLMGCFNTEDEIWESVCKIGTGFSEEILQKLTDEMRANTIPSKPLYYRASDKCDVWFSPAFVWEVMAADLSISPVHFAGSGKTSSGKGVALRFPRFLRVRDDKKPEDATSSSQVVEMFLAQSTETADTLNE